MDSNTDFAKKQAWLPSVLTNERHPPCLYPEVIVMANGSESSISIASDLRRPPASGGYWACSQCSLVDDVTSYQIPVRSSDKKKPTLRKRLLKQISYLFSCCLGTTKQATTDSLSDDVISIRSVSVHARSGDAFVRSVHPAIQRLRKRHEGMYAIFNEDPFY